MTSIESELDLDPDNEQDVPIEPTREQELSRKTFRELQQICKSPAYNLSAEGNTATLIARILEFEQTGLSDDVVDERSLSPADLKRATHRLPRGRRNPPRRSRRPGRQPPPRPTSPAASRVASRVASSAIRTPG